MGLLDPFTQFSKKLIFDQTHSHIHPCAVQLKSNVTSARPRANGLLPICGHKGCMRKAIVRESLYGQHHASNPHYTPEGTVEFSHDVETKDEDIRTENNNNNVEDLLAVKKENGEYKNQILPLEINSVKFNPLFYQQTNIMKSIGCKLSRNVGDRHYSQHPEGTKDLEWRKLSTNVLKQQNFMINTNLIEKAKMHQIPKGYSPQEHISRNEEEGHQNLYEKINKKRKYYDALYSNKHIAKKTKKSKIKKQKIKCCPMKSQFVVEGFKKKNEITAQVDNQAWWWKGEPFRKAVFLNNYDPMVERTCYPAIKHKKTGLVVRVKDCVLLRVDDNEDNPPSVAKVASFWEDPESGEMMMSLLWYYRPEDVEHNSDYNHSPNEVYASRHADHTSVDCIEDKCYVLPLNEYCRYQRRAQADEEGIIEEPSRVPPLPHTDNSHDIPLNKDPELILYCQRVFNFRTRRLMKPPEKFSHWPSEK